MRSFHSPNGENPEILDIETLNKKVNIPQCAASQPGCIPAVCAPEPGVWPWGAPVPSPSSRKSESEK